MIKDITAKTLLSSGKQPDPWFGIKYTMNLYRGCQHQCIYCDSRSECYQIENFADILVKANAIELLRAELPRKRVKGTVGTGSMNDPYMPLEAHTPAYGTGAGGDRGAPLSRARHHQERPRLARRRHAGCDRRRLCRREFHRHHRGRRTEQAGRAGRAAELSALCSHGGSRRARDRDGRDADADTAVHRRQRGQHRRNRASARTPAARRTSWPRLA